jgi:isopentenyldiphosphate isomerase
MKNLNISEAVLRKLKEAHGVSKVEVEQCFLNRQGRLLIDNRVATRTNPPTLWFVACTNKGRPLKVVYIQRGESVELKTAYDPNEEEARIYKRHG